MFPKLRHGVIHFFYRQYPIAIAIVFFDEIKISFMGSKYHYCEMYIINVLKFEMLYLKVNFDP